MEEILQMTRHESREQAFALMFEKLFSPELAPQEIIESKADLSEFTRDDFSETLFLTACEHMEEIDRLIRENLVRWSFDRLSKVSVAVLRIAIGEINYLDDIPQSVSINEAVEIAKKYSGEEDAAFVNGVLGSIAKGAEVKRHAGLSGD